MSPTTMSLRVLIIGIVVVLAASAAAALLVRNSGTSRDAITVNGQAIGGEAAPDTSTDPTEEYMRSLGPPDTSGLALMGDAPSDTGEPVPLPGPPIGAQAPAFTLRNVTGETFRLGSTRGRVVILNFWATWCEPCRDEIPGLITLQERYSDEGLRVVGVSIEDESEPVADFTNAFPFNYPLLVEGRQVAAEYGADVAVPTSVILDRRGRIVDRIYGAVHRDTLESHIRPLL